MDPKVEKILQWRREGFAPPHRVEIHPTDRCNLKCKMCGTRSIWKESKKDIKKIQEENQKAELSDEKLLGLIDSLEKMGVNRVLLTGGGEPFIRKGLVLEMMKKIKDADIFGDITTNGTLLDKEDLGKIVEMGWDSITFSLDAANKEMQDNLRNVSGTFDKIRKNISHLKKLKSKKNSLKPRIVLSTVLTEINYEKIPQIGDFANILECNEITLRPLIDPGKYPDLEISNKEKLLESLDEFKDITDNYELKSNVQSLIKGYQNGEEKFTEKLKKDEEKSHSPYPTCFKPFLNMVVWMDGRVTSCCITQKSGENLKDKPLEDIWRGKHFTNLRESFRKGRLPEDCSQCNLSKRTRNDVIRSELDMENTVLGYLKRENKELCKDIESKNKVLDETKRKITEEEKKVEEREEEIERLKEDIRKKEKQREEEVRKRDKKIDELEKELAEIKESISYRMGSSLGKTKLGKILKKE